MADRIGETLSESYRIERLIGGGAMGKVYAAVHVRLPRQFAIKILNHEFAAKAELLERFRREAEIASSLGHEHIVEVFDFNRTPDGLPYMVMELLQGQDLRQFLNEHGRLSVDKTIELVADVADALAVAHARGIVHRDLKPENVFLCIRGNRRDFIKVLDFGVSKILDSATLATTATSVMGTPNYMAPEQAIGSSRSIDQRADVFALGALAYECLTGEFAFEGPTPIGVLYSVVHHVPRALADFRSDVPAAVDQVIVRALSKEPENRQQNAGRFRRELLSAYGIVEPESADKVEYRAERSSPVHSGAVDSAPTMLSASNPIPAQDNVDIIGVPTLARASLTAAPRPPLNQSRGLRVALALLGVAALGALGVFALERSGAAHRLTNTEDSAHAEQPMSPSTPVAPRVEPCMALIEFEIEPRDARVELNGVVMSGRQLSLPCSERVNHLSVSASGFRTESREVVALVSGKVFVKLTPSNAALPAPRPVRVVPTPAPRRPSTPEPKASGSLGPVERSL